MKFMISFFLVAVLAAAQDDTGKITGVVVDAVSHQPLRKVTVSLMVNKGSGLNGVALAVTDASGAFTFDKLKPGLFSVNVTRNDSTYPMGKTVKANASENPEPLTVEMMPGAAISGRVLDEDGDPMSGCTLQLYMAGSDQGLVPRFRLPVGRSGYRLTGLTPGKYLASAECDGQPFQPRPFSAGANPPESLAYPVQFYPDVPDMATAEPVELMAGVEKVGIDLRMRPARVTQVRVALAAPGVAPDDGAIDIKLIPAKGSAEPVRAINDSNEQEGGRFEFPRVFPGSYLVVVTTVEFSGTERIEVKDRPVNATIQLNRGIDINGIMDVESGSNREQMRLQETSFRLIPDYPEFPQAATSLPQQRFGKEVAVKEDGSFTLKSVVSGEWRLQVTSPSAFVKSAWLGSADVTGQPFVVNGGETGALRIVLSGNTATIRGTASPGDFVQAISLGVPGPGGPGRVDQSGQFRIEGLAPGKYIVRAMPGEEGKEITVEEGETVTVDLRD